MTESESKARLERMYRRKAGFPKTESGHFTHDQVREIRAAYDSGVAVGKLIAKYQHSETSIYDVVRRRSFKHVK